MTLIKELVACPSVAPKERRRVPKSIPRTLLIYNVLSYLFVKFLFEFFSIIYMIQSYYHSHLVLIFDKRQFPHSLRRPTYNHM